MRILIQLVCLFQIVYGLTHPRSTLFRYNQWEKLVTVPDIVVYTSSLFASKESAYNRHHLSALEGDSFVLNSITDLQKAKVIAVDDVHGYVPVLLEMITTGKNNQSKEYVFRCIRVLLKTLLKITRSGNSDTQIADICMSLLHRCEEEKIELPNDIRMLISKILVFSNNKALLKVMPMIFLEDSLPKIDALENVMRAFSAIRGTELSTLQLFQMYYDNISTRKSLTDICYWYAIKASFLASDEYEIIGGNFTSFTSLLKMAFENDSMTKRMVVNCFALCRKEKRCMSAIEVYSVAKLAVRNGKLYDFVEDNNKPNNKYKRVILDKLPSVIYGQACVTIAKGGAEVQVFQVICEMLEDGIVPFTLTLDSVFLELSKRGAFDTMLLILDQLQRYRVEVSNICLNAILNACNKAGEYSKMLDIFSSSRMNINQIDDIGIGVLIKACDKLAQPESAVFIIESAIDNGIEIADSIYERVFAILVKTKSSKLAVRLLLQMELLPSDGVRDGPEYLQPLSMVNKSNRNDDIDNQSEYLNSDDDEDTMVIIDKILTKNLNSQSSLKEDDSRLKDLNDKTILSKCAFFSGFDADERETLEYDDLDVVEAAALHLIDESTYFEDDSIYLEDSLLDQLLKLDRPPLASSRIYAGAISALSKSGRATDAFKLLENYIERGGNDIEEMYTSAIFAWRFTRNSTEAEKVMQLLKSRRKKKGNNNLSLTVASYNAILLVYAVSGILEEKQHKILNEIKEAGLELDTSSYTALMMGQQNRTKALELWNELISKENVVPSIASVMEVLKVCVMTKNGKMAINVIDYLWGNYEKTAVNDVDVDVDNETSKIDNRGSTFDNPIIKSNSIKPDDKMCMLVLMSLARSEYAAEECWNMIQKMRDKDIEPSSSCYSITFLALEKAGDWKKTVNMLLSMYYRGLKVDSRSVNAAISACAKAGQWDMIVKLYDLMPSISRKNFIPNFQTFVSVIHAIWKVEDAEKGFETLKTMISHNFLPPYTSTSQVISLLEKESSNMTKNTTSSMNQEKSVYMFENMISAHIAMNSDVDQSEPMIIDLHGYTISVARAATRSALKLLHKEYCDQLSVSNKGDVKPSKSADRNIFRDLQLITGRGKNSKHSSILKPAIKDFLKEEFNLNATIKKDNTGRLVIRGKCLLEWVKKKDSL